MSVSEQIGQAIDNLVEGIMTAVRSLSLDELLAEAEVGDATTKKSLPRIRGVRQPVTIGVEKPKLVVDLLGAGPEEVETAKKARRRAPSSAKPWQLRQRRPGGQFTVRFTHLGKRFEMPTKTAAWKIAEKVAQDLYEKATAS